MWGQPPRLSCGAKLRPQADGTTSVISPRQVKSSSFVSGWSRRGWYRRDWYRSGSYRENSYQRVRIRGFVSGRGFSHAVTALKSKAPLGAATSHKIKRGPRSSEGPSRERETPQAALLFAYCSGFFSNFFRQSSEQKLYVCPWYCVFDCALLSSIFIPQTGSVAIEYLDWKNFYLCRFSTFANKNPLG